mmetsp:Transcript_3953/g.12275  ORF Transcript_3953/g.12275 Transcript_3953/m.12275 type:complete len:99 (+) Transcript_3953:2687-2983(+)
MRRRVPRRRRRPGTLIHHSACVISEHLTKHFLRFFVFHLRVVSFLPFAFPWFLCRTKKSLKAASARDLSFSCLLEQIGAKPLLPRAFAEPPCILCILS